MGLYNTHFSLVYDNGISGYDGEREKENGQGKEEGEDGGEKEH